MPPTQNPTHVCLLLRTTVTQLLYYYCSEWDLMGQNTLLFLAAPHHHRALYWMERAVYRGGENAHLLTFKTAFLKGIFIFTASIAVYEFKSCCCCCSCSCCSSCSCDTLQIRTYLCYEVQMAHFNVRKPFEKVPVNIIYIHSRVLSTRTNK